ncbi:MAG: BON domain-containing protein [Vicinamibacterales bacterium]
MTLAVTALTGAFGCAARQASTTTGDEVLRARVEAALAGASDVDAAGITVDARRGVVTLTGRVASPTEQQSVGAIVRAIPGVRDVAFSLSIADPGALP